MMDKIFWNRLSRNELLILLFLFISGFGFIVFIWHDTKHQEIDKILKIAGSVAASLPKEEIQILGNNPEEIESHDFGQLKDKLQQIVKVNSEAKFAYIYIQRNGKLYFVVDSEPEDSPDYSPPGQEFTEAGEIDKKPFNDGLASVTEPITDRWGTWVSVEIPIKDMKTGNVIAVFGMDYNANSWKNRILFQVVESTLLAIIIMVLALIVIRSMKRNLWLKKEIALRKSAEMGLKESESYYRLLFELNPQPMFVYDLDSMQILAVNQSAISCYGYSQEEFVKMSILDLTSTSEQTRFWENSQQAEIWSHQLKNGNQIQVEVHSHNLDFRHKNARLVLLVDITKKLKTENALLENQSALSNLISNLPGFVYRSVFAEEFFVEYMSDATTRITGYSPADFIRHKSVSFNDLILPEYRNSIVEKWREVVVNHTFFEEEYPIRTASGEIKWIWERGGCVLKKNGDIDYIEGYIEDVTTRKMAEEALRQSETNFNRSIEESPFGVRIVTDQGETVYSNPTLLKIFGFNSLDDFNQIPATNWYVPESYSEHLQREDKRRTGSSPEKEYEISIVTSNKDIRNLQVFRNRIVWNGAENDQIIYLDITERKRAERELEKLSMAIEQNPVSVVITDSKGDIEYVNPRFVEITGYHKDEVIGENPRILKSGKMDTILSGKIWQGEFINKKKSGEFYWDNKSISPIMDASGRITNFVAIGDDITEKKHNEEELIKAKEKAEESDRLKSAFLANISHEIRTPMNGILGFAELLKEPDLTPEFQMEFIDVIEKSGLRMLNIINDLIDISKVEAGETSVRIRKANLNIMFKDLHLFFMPEAKHKNINIDYHCDQDDEHSMIETDSTKLNQIMTNLIKNAVKFTDSGSIKFGYRLNNTRFEFYVSDTGPGIPDDQKKLIFERFIQGSMSLTRKHEGAGLGLAISKAFIELLGGTIMVETEIGKGSTFRFDLPMVYTDRPKN
jgi:PAS domain S-box-containing protein